MKKILFVVGSLCSGSFNTQFAKNTEKVLEGEAEVSYPDWVQVPVFSQDLEANIPTAVQAARQAVSEADAIWIFLPVYSFAIPGSTKNLLDWLSRATDLSDPTGPSVINEKVTTVSILANGGHEQATESYRALLPFTRTQSVDEITTARVNGSAWADGVFIPTEEVLANLDKQAQALLSAID